MNVIAFKLNWDFLSSIYEYLRVVLDIGIVWLILYYILKIFRNNSRTMQIFKGIVLIIIVKIVADFLKLSTLSFLLDWVLQWGTFSGYCDFPTRDTFAFRTDGDVADIL